MTILQLIEQAIRQSPKQAIPFNTYMELCLYAPEVGYYTSARVKIGKDGDFYTSSNLGTIMGEIVAQTIMKVYYARARKDQPLMLTEWGGGTGRLAAQVLDEMKRVDEQLYLHTYYYSEEISRPHRRIQVEHLIEHQSRCLQKIEDAPSDAYRFGWANELIDAFPCRRFRKGKFGLEEMFVQWKESGPSALWVSADERSAEKYASIWQKVAMLQQFERIVGVEEWVNRVSGQLDSLVVIDYGAELEELIGPHRMNGTFICYFNHQAADDPFNRIGEQDMTAHVDFTELRLAAQLAGFKSVSVMTQKQFLLDAGLLSRIQEHPGLDPFHPIVKRNRAIRQLLISDQMSELFKVCIAHK